MHLVMCSELDVCDISLAELVRDYLEAVAQEPFELEAASEFLLTAATLVCLKSRRLLPEPAAEPDEPYDDLPTGRDGLLARMLECETFRRAGAALAQQAAQAALSAPRQVGPEARYYDLLGDPLADVEPEDLAAAYRRALAAADAEATVDLGHVGHDEIRVGDVVAELTLRLPTAGLTTFGDLTRALQRRHEVVAHFLALLELFKQSRVELRQASPLGSIQIEWRSPTDIMMTDIEGADTDMTDVEPAEGAETGESQAALGERAL